MYMHTLLRVDFFSIELLTWLKPLCKRVEILEEWSRREVSFEHPKHMFLS